MNFYDILDVHPNASKSDIKKAYHNLVMQYHPDKCTDKDASKKFQEIQTAYEVLYDDDKRKKYDNMTNEQKLQAYDLIKQYFTDINPQHSYIYNSIIDFIYGNNKDEFEQEINSLNIKKIFSRIAEKINLKTNKDNHIINITNNYHEIKLSLKEKYESNFKYVRIIKDDNSYNKYIVPLFDDEFIINDPDKGNINIKITCELDKNYKIIDKQDLLFIRNISLSQYIYGGKIKVYFPNGESSWFEFESCLEKKPIFVMENKGLPKIDFTNQTPNRGNLFIYLTVEGINSIVEDDVAQTYSKVVEDTIKLMFPPID
jgi:DnaJ-class molecular chaperone